MLKRHIRLVLGGNLLLSASTLFTMTPAKFPPLETPATTIIFPADRVGYAGSDIDNFAHEGGMIELATVSNSIKMIINLNTSRQAGLMLSSKLLELGSVIDQ